MYVKLEKSQLLREKADENYDLMESIYFAYNKKKGYGNHIIEIPIDDKESIFTSGEYDNYSMKNTVFSKDSLFKHNSLKKSLKRKKNGTILKVVPFEYEPIDRMCSPIKQVRVLEFVFPIDSNISLRSDSDTKYYFDWIADMADYKRVVATKYDKLKDEFCRTLEERSLSTVQQNSYENNEIEYYKSWLYSQGNNDMVKIAQNIDLLINNAKTNSKIAINLEDIEKFIQNGKFYFFRLDDQTRNWIKLQPYKKAKYFVDNKGKKSVTLIEEKYSRKYLELFGLELNNNYNVHSIIKNFTTKKRIVTDDFIGMFKQFLNKNEFNEVGVSQPIQVLTRKKLTLRSSDNEELYKGHIYNWEDAYITKTGRYIKFYIVFMIDEVCKK